MQPAINDDLTYRIIGYAMKVHATLGNGFQEVIYQRCLQIEMEQQGLSFAREQHLCRKVKTCFSITPILSATSQRAKQK